MGVDFDNIYSNLTHETHKAYGAHEAHETHENHKPHEPHRHIMHMSAESHKHELPKWLLLSSYPPDVGSHSLIGRAMFTPSPAVACT